jgi:aminoglycoside phosphotransferase (APT) family kinase protein
LTTVGVERPAFLAWLDANRPELGDGPLHSVRLKGGSSMTILKLTRGAESAVLRFPSIPPRADSAKALAREGRLLGAIGGSAIPHAQLHAYVTDAEVLGAPFLLMEYIDGWTNWGEDRKPPPPYDQPGPHFRDLAFAMIDGIASIRTVDYKAAGLEDFGNPDGFLMRQVPRYLKLIESYKQTENHPGREIPGMAYVTDWLQANTPPMSATTIIHGDIGYPNMMLTRSVPSKVAAVIDWEVATIGDPLLDLARAIFGFAGRKVTNTRGDAVIDPFAPTREDMAEYYAEKTGADVSTLDYYVVLSVFRLCALIEWNYARHVNGRDASGLAKWISGLILELMAFAEDVARAAKL